MSHISSEFGKFVDPQKVDNVTLYESLVKTKGECLPLARRDIAELLSTPKESSSKKTVPLIGGYELNESQRRSNDNVEINTLGIFDIDNAQSMSFEKIVSLLKEHQCIVHTTYSNCVSHLKLRVILFLTRPINPHEYHAFWQGFTFFTGLTEIIDPACKDLSRAYFLFSYPPEGKEHARCFINLGKPVDPALYSKRNNKSPLAAALSEQIQPQSVLPGGRNTALTRLVGQLINKGLRREDTINEANRWNAALPVPLDNEEVLRTHNSIWKTHEKGKLESQVPQNTNVVNDYSFVRAFDLLSTPPVPRRYLLDQFLMERVVSLLVAPGGTGKSMLTLLIAVCVASGISLFDRFQAKAPRRVLFISGEDDLEELKRRLFKILVDESAKVRALVAQNLVFIDFADKFELFTEKPIQGEIRITDVPEKIIESLKQQIGDDIALVIVDPAARFRGGDENLAADATRFVQALQLIRDRLSCAVLAVHHVNKAARGAASGQNNARGSSAFIDGVRLVYELSALSEQEIAKRYGSLNIDTQLLNLTCVKTNYGKRIEPLLLERRENGTLAAASRLPENLQLTLILREIKTCPMSKSAFKEKYGGIEKKFRISEKVLLRKIDELQEKGLLNVPSRSSMMVTRNGEEFITNGQSGKERERSES